MTYIYIHSRIHWNQRTWFQINVWSSWEQDFCIKDHFGNPLRPGSELLQQLFVQEFFDSMKIFAKAHKLQNASIPIDSAAEFSI